MVCEINAFIGSFTDNKQCFMELHFPKFLIYFHTAVVIEMTWEPNECTHSTTSERSCISMNTRKLMLDFPREVGGIRKEDLRTRERKPRPWPNICRWPKARRTWNSWARRTSSNLIPDWRHWTNEQLKGEERRWDGMWQQISLKPHANLIGAWLST